MTTDLQQAMSAIQWAEKVEARVSFFRSRFTCKSVCMVKVGNNIQCEAPDFLSAITLTQQQVAKMAPHGRSR